MGGETRCLALDFGASNIRLIDVALSGGWLDWSELARFDNAPRPLGERLVWDYDAIYRQVTAALCAAGKSGVRYASIGVDSWGVDYVLLDERGKLAGPAVSYRDLRTTGQIERYVSKHLPPRYLFTVTGLQCLPFNTIFQLFAQSQSEPEALKRAARLLFTADYAHYWLSGVAANERTLSSTSQMLTTKGNWLSSVVKSVGLNPGALSQPVRAGTILGKLRPELAGQTALGEIPVIAPATHDTQSAILCTPATGDGDWAYLSSGTWSIIGLESTVPFTDPRVAASGIGNETGYGNTYCVQYTVAGLWLVQEIQRLLGKTSIEELAAQAERAVPFRSIVNPADERFFSPANMIGEIKAACREEDEPVPETPAQLVRCAYDSLALLYRKTLQELSAFTGRKFTRLHVLGGGSKSALLNRLCSAATGLPLYAGPSEATALGNGLAQLIALEKIADVAQARKLVADSFPPELVQPGVIPQLEDAVRRFQRISARHEPRPA